MRILVTSLFALACALPLPGQAQSDYPNRPIRMLVGYTAGGSVDATARAIAERLGPALGTTVIVENRAGATGNIAAVAAARAAPVRWLRRTCGRTRPCLRARRRS